MPGWQNSPCLQVRLFIYGYENNFIPLFTEKNLEVIYKILNPRIKIKKNSNPVKVNITEKAYLIMILKKRLLELMTTTTHDYYSSSAWYYITPQRKPTSLSLASSNLQIQSRGAGRFSKILILPGINWENNVWGIGIVPCSLNGKKKAGFLKNSVIPIFKSRSSCFYEDEDKDDDDLIEEKKVPECKMGTKHDDKYNPVWQTNRLSQFSDWYNLGETGMSP